MNGELYGGWGMILSGLKTLLETGEDLTTPGSLRYSGARTPGRDACGLEADCADGGDRSRRVAALARGTALVLGLGRPRVIALDPDGGHDVMARVDAFPFSIDWLPDGPMLITAGRELLRMEPDGSLVTHVDLSDLSDYGWNEIVVDGRGNAYVNGPGFDMMAGGDFAPGTIAIVRPDGSAEQVAGGVAFPNGMAVTPDDSTLIVADSYAKELTAFDIGDDGTLTNRRRWADLGEGTRTGSASMLRSRLVRGRPESTLHARR